MGPEQIISNFLKPPHEGGHPAGELMMSMRMAGQLSTPTEMRRFIEGFN